MSNTLRIAPDSRFRTIVYWITTAVIAFESAMGGVWDILRIDTVVDIAVDYLGYPSYLLIILGIAKIPGAVVLIAPRLPRLKEWVYAGVLFIYLGAAISLAVQGDPAAAGPLGFATMTCLSWATRPRDRRVVAASSWKPARFSGRPGFALGFWVATGIVTSVLLGGGIADLLRRGGTVAGMLELGYPEYFVPLLGVCKILGASAILVPGFGRLKEWAYAGAFYNFVGAFASHIAAGSSAAHLLWTAAFAACVLISWALRPASRRLEAAAVVSPPATEQARKRLFA